MADNGNLPNEHKRWPETTYAKAEGARRRAQGHRLPHELRRVAAAVHARRRRRHRLQPRHRLSGRVPVHTRRPGDDVPRPALVDPAVRRLRHARGDERALQVPPEGGPARPLRRLRPADAARLRLRRPALGRRGREGRRRHRHARRHGDDVRRHPARPGLDFDDDQRSGVRARRDVRGRRPEAGRAAGPRIAGPRRTTSSRSTSPAGPTSTRRSRRSASPPT